MAANQSSVIGRATVVRGRVSGSGDLEIAGRVEGDVACSGEVTVESTGLVGANINGSRIVIRGAVKGDCIADEAIVIDAGARVVGDLRAPRITIAAGGLVRGHVQTGNAGAARPRAASASASASRAEPAKKQAAVAKPASKPAAKAAPPPPKALPKPAPKAAAAPKAKPAQSNHRAPPPGSRIGSAISGRVPPAPVVPVLRKGTKAVQKKRPY